MHRLIDLLLELQLLDRVPRSGYALRGVPRPESVAEHLFHTVFLAWSLAASEPELDRTRVLELALVHDLAEVRFGDLPRTAASYLPPGAKRQAEAAAAADLLTPLEGRAQKLFEEYQAKATPEAKFVSACDKLQILLKSLTYEQQGCRSLGEFWEDLDRFPDHGFTSIRETVAELRRRREELLGS